MDRFPERKKKQNSLEKGKKGGNGWIWRGKRKDSSVKRSKRLPLSTPKRVSLYTQKTKPKRNYLKKLCPDREQKGTSTKNKKEEPLNRFSRKGGKSAALERTGARICGRRGGSFPYASNSGREKGRACCFSKTTGGVVSSYTKRELKVWRKGGGKDDSEGTSSFSRKKKEGKKNWAPAKRRG